MTKNYKAKVTEKEVKEFNELTEDDFEAEIDQREFAMFWDSLDLDNWWNILKVFAIRFAYIMV